MEMLFDLAMTFWQWTIVICLIIIGFIINSFDKKEEKRIGFTYMDMPKMQPVPIATKGKGFWKGIWMWITGVRHWVVCEDFHYTLNGEGYMIPAGFQFDGASVPKFLATFLSPVGVLLMGGLVHDYGYRYGCLKKVTGEHTDRMTQKELDVIFRDICIEVNGFKVLNYLAWAALYVAGFVAWNNNRKAIP